jgi:formyl-CoA transferase
VALYEAVFNVMESLLPEYSAFGTVREPAGSALPGIAPSNAYRCADGWVLVAGNGDSIFKRLMVRHRPRRPGRATRAGAQHRPRGAGGRDRRRHRRLDAPQTVDAVLRALDAASVPAGRVYTVADIVADPHYQARDMMLKQPTRDGHEVLVPGIVPKLSGTPGAVRSSAPKLGDDTDAVLRELGMPEPRVGVTMSRDRK